MGPFNSSGSPQRTGAVANAAGVRASPAESSKVLGKIAFAQEVSYHQDKTRDEKNKVI